jgi:hypothetical protein
MKRKFILLLLGGSLSQISFAQDNQLAVQKTDSIKPTTVDNINWQSLVKRDVVTVGQSMADLQYVDPYTVISARFYGRDMSPLINVSRDGGKNIPFLVQDNSRVVSVKALSDGGVVIYLATRDLIGSFIENVKLTGPFYNQVFTIQGYLPDPNEKKKDKKKHDKN